MIGIYNRFCGKCNENNCKQRKNEHFFCWNAIIYNIRNLPFNMLSLHRKLPQKDADECRHGSDSPDIGRKIQQPHSSRVQPIFSVARVECGLPFLCNRLTQGEDYSLSNAFPTHALGI